MKPDDKVWSGRRRRRFKPHPLLSACALTASLSLLAWAAAPLFGT
jgi:hypothetical protein